jgi:hypothetical protein
MPGFSTMSGCMRFVVDKVAVGQAVVRVLLFPMSVLFRQWSIIIFIVILVLSEGQASEAWELSFLGAFCTEKLFDILFFYSVFRQSNEWRHRTERRESACAAFCPVHVMIIVLYWAEFRKILALSLFTFSGELLPRCHRSSWTVHSFILYCTASNQQYCCLETCCERFLAKVGTAVPIDVYLSLQFIAAIFCWTVSRNRVILGLYRR